MRLRIHFLGLGDKDAALFQRILDFASRQQRDYRIVGQATDADLLICDSAPASHERARQTIADRPVHLLLVGAEQPPAQPREHALARPLLVTRVMRELDRIAALIEASPPAPEPAPEPSAPAATDAVCETPRVSPAPHQSTALMAVQRHTWQKPAAPAPVPQPGPRPALREESTTVTNPPPATAPTKAEPEADTRVRYRALVVDDSLAIRKQLELELRDAGIEADFAEDGETALEKAASNHYDLIFLDIMMPGIDGYEVCRELRKQPQWKKTPITMLSGKTSPLDEVEGVLAGCSTYLTKPVKHDDFQKMLERVRRWIDTTKGTVN